MHSQRAQSLMPLQLMPVGSKRTSQAMPEPNLPQCTCATPSCTPLPSSPEGPRASAMPQAAPPPCDCTLVALAQNLHPHHATLELAAPPRWLPEGGAMPPVHAQPGAAAAAASGRCTPSPVVLLLLHSHMAIYPYIWPFGPAPFTLPAAGAAAAEEGQ